MKKLLIAGSALLAGALAYHLLQPAPQPVSEATARPAPSSDIPENTVLRTNADAQEVFRRAFWRDPSMEDQILHAERREWVSENDNVRRWQWFLHLKPSPGFSAWLRETNPFNLAPSSTSSVAPSASFPVWFPMGAALKNLTVLQAADHAMTIILDPASGQLYATDCGHGFAAAPGATVATPSGAPIALRQEPPPPRARN